MLQLLKIKKSLLCCLQTAGKVKGVTPEYIRVVCGFQQYYTKGMLVELLWMCYSLKQSLTRSDINK